MRWQGCPRATSKCALLSLFGSAGEAPAQTPCLCPLVVWRGQAPQQVKNQPRALQVNDVQNFANAGRGGGGGSERDTRQNGGGVHQCPTQPPPLRSRLAAQRSPARGGHTCILGSEYINRFSNQRKDYLADWPFKARQWNIKRGDWNPVRDGCHGRHKGQGGSLK